MENEAQGFFFTRHRTIGSHLHLHCRLDFRRSGEDAKSAPVGDGLERRGRERSPIVSLLMPSNSLQRQEDGPGAWFAVWKLVCSSAQPWPFHQAARWHA